MDIQFEAIDLDGDEIHFHPQDLYNIPDGHTLYENGKLIINERVTHNASFAILLADTRNGQSMYNIQTYVYTCPCLHGGWCRTKNGAGHLEFQCVCPEGYTGKLCEPSTVGQWGPWMSWTHCSKACDYGMRVRTRHCLEEPCPDWGHDREFCNQYNCEGDTLHIYFNPGHGF